MTVGDIERRMSWRELRDWRRFEGFHQPLPDKLDDLHVAMLASMMVNLTRTPESMPAQVTDFLMIQEPKPPPKDDGLSEVDRQRLAWRGG